MTQTAPTVSVIMPVYEGERFIAEALHSLLAQHRPPDEIVVVDDGCTDRSIEVVHSVLQGMHREPDDAPNVRIIHRTNGGPAAARNTGIANTHHELIAFHDADDIAGHTRHLARHVGTAQPIVRARRSPIGEGLQVLVYTRDEPDLFARICGYFDQHGYSILDARIHTARNGYALDTFQVVAPDLTDHYREVSSLVDELLRWSP